MRDQQERFREFFDAEYRSLRRFAYLLTGDWNDAEDLVQTAMMRTYRAWNRIRDRERPGVYARAAIANGHRSRLRHLKVQRRHATETMDIPSSPLGEDGVVVWRALQDVPDRQRAALVLRFYEDLPEAEIAAILECPIGTVKSYIHRGLERLRAALGPAYEIANAKGDAS